MSERKVLLLDLDLAFQPRQRRRAYPNLRPWEHVRVLSFLRKRATLMPIYPEQATESDGIDHAHAALTREKQRNSPMNWRFSKDQSQQGSNTELPEGGRTLATLFDNINDVAAEKEKERRQEKRVRSEKTICGRKKNEPWPEKNPSPLQHKCSTKRSS